MQKLQEYSLELRHEYRKTLSGRSNKIKWADLLEVFITKDRNLSDGFIDYNSKTIEGGIWEEVQDKGRVIVLVFKKPQYSIAANIFTVLKKWTEQEEQFFIEAIGKRFKIIQPERNSS